MEEDNFDIVERLAGYESSKRLHNSKAYKLLNEHQVDNNEILGIDKQPEAGSYTIRDKDPELQKAKENNFLEGFLELGESLKNSDVITSIKSRVPEGLINIADFGTNIFNSFDKLFSLDPTYERSEIFNKWSENFDNTRNILREKRKEVEGTWSDMAGMVFQDLPVTLALYPVFNKFMSKPKAAALAFGVGYAMSFDEEKTSIFMDSETVTKLKHLIKVLPDTPEDQLADDVIEAFEGTGMALLIPGLIKGFQFVKKTLPKETVSDLSKIAAGGTVIATAATEAKSGEKDFSDEEMLKRVEDARKMVKEKGISFEEASKITQSDSYIPSDAKSGEKPVIDVSDPKLMEMGLQSGFTKAVPKIIEKGKELLSPVFKSNVVEAVNKIPNKGSGNQILGQIKNIPGVKETELKWIGLDDFLKNKKTVTKKEVSEFVQSNRIDVNEVQFGGKTTQFSDELKLKIDKFEKKYHDQANVSSAGLSGHDYYGRANYDVYAISFGKEPGTMDFNTLSTALGKSPKLDDMIKLPNGNLAIRRDNVRTVDEIKTLKDVFQISPLEFEKYQVEEAKRLFRTKNINQPKFLEQTEPGGKDYTELVFSLKTGGMEKGIPIRTIKDLKIKGRPGEPIKIHGKGVSPFKGGHFDVKSEIAHVRFKTRGHKDLKVLTVEEMQSDFAIATRKKTTTGEEVKDFPFKQNWYEMVTKRLIRYAADNGFDAIAIPKGSVAAKRYGQNIDKIKKIEIQKTAFDKSKYEGWTQLPESELTVLYYNNAGKIIDEKTFPSTPQRMELFKKEIGSKEFSKIEEALKKGDVEHLLEKPIIIGSGKGKAELYDKAIPSFMKKYAKKWNAKVYDDKLDDIVSDTYNEINRSNIPVTILEITPAMKKAVQEGSQSLFEILGFATSAGVGAKAVSDNIQNNNISN